MSACGICGGSGGKHVGSGHVPGCMRYRYAPSAARHEQTRRGMGEPETKRASGYGGEYCRICQGPHQYKHGRA